ncbi:hypothetical protein KCP70_22230 [Salmonella enterica subsp. enterica]|nr:hypothetical protein KCP70_22230 [Salmonella enterica subsp. enterica]
MPVGGTGGAGAPGALWAADALHVSLNGVIDMNPSSTLGVFYGGSGNHLRLGLETLLGVLGTSSRRRT